jgi:hypothetical protein
MSGGDLRPKRKAAHVVTLESLTCAAPKHGVFSMSTILDSHDPGNLPASTDPESTAATVRRIARGLARLASKEAAADPELSGLVDALARLGAEPGEASPPHWTPGAPLPSVQLPPALLDVDLPLREAEEGAAVDPASATPGALLVMIRAARVRLREAARSMPTDAPPPSRRRGA